MNKRLISLIVVAMLLLGAGALAERTVTVQGIGTVNVDADRVSITMGVRVVADDVQAAQSMTNESVDAIIQAVKAMGDSVVSVTTSGIGIYPNYNYDDGGETIIGYNAYNSINITLSDVNAAGACIDMAFAAGANSLDYVSFAAADTADAADRALELAMESAAHKAQVLADAAGVRLGEILEIRDGSDTGFSPYESYARTEADDADVGGTQVLASQQAVTANVSVTYAIAE